MEYVNVIILREWLEEIKTQMDKIGIEYGFVDYVTINRKAHSFWGRCHKIAINHFKIELSEDCLLCDKTEIKETLAHELVHTCKGCFNHGEQFKKIAYIMNTTYGYNIKRTSTIIEKGLSIAEMKERYKYILECEGCSHKYYFTRKNRYINNFNNCACSICNGKLKLTEL